jgi:hypothetical protein
LKSWKCSWFKSGRSSWFKSWRCSWFKSIIEKRTHTLSFSWVYGFWLPRLVSSNFSSGVGSAKTSGAPEVTPVLSGVRVAQSIVFCVQGQSRHFEGHCIMYCCLPLFNFTGEDLGIKEEFEDTKRVMRRQ